MSRLPVKEEQQRLHVIQLVVADQSHQVAAHGLPILLFRDVGRLEPLFQHHPHIRQISGSAQWWLLLLLVLWRNDDIRRFSRRIWNRRRWLRIKIALTLIHLENFILKIHLHLLSFIRSFESSWDFFGSFRLALPLSSGRSRFDGRLATLKDGVPVLGSWRWIGSSLASSDVSFDFRFYLIR